MNKGIFSGEKRGWKYKWFWKVFFGGFYFNNNVGGIIRMWGDESLLILRIFLV